MHELYAWILTWTREHAVVLDRRTVGELEVTLLAIGD
jgi:hypothetical protein